MVPTRCAILTAVLVLAACTQAPEPRQAVAASDMGWALLHADGEGEKLVYGRPQSDDVLLMLTCAPDSGDVRVAATAPVAGPEPAVGLRSDGARRIYAAEAGPAGFGDGVVLEAVTHADDPVLARFAASGELSLEVAGHAAVLPPAGVEQARRFLASCRN